MPKPTRRPQHAELPAPDDAVEPLDNPEDADHPDVDECDSPHVAVGVELVP
jgi:hypothetical protein